MVRDLKTRCLAKGVDSNGWFIVMDSWYCSNNMLDKISESGFIVVIESNYVFYMDIQGNPLRYNVSGLSEVVRWREGNRI